MARKQARKRKPRNYQGYRLIETPSGLVWKKLEQSGQSPGDQVLERVLSKFGWSRTPEGRLEHTGAAGNDSSPLLKKKAG